MRKIISLIVALCVMLTPTFPAFAAEAEDPALEKVISNVKKIIEIPSSYTEFSYEYVASDDDNSENKIWTLYWSDLESGSDIEISVDWMGNVLYYDRYDYNSGEDGLAKVSRAQGEVTAQKILQKLCPQLASNMKEINIEENKTNFDELAYDYQYYANGLPVSYINVSICISKYTGELSSVKGLPEGFVLPIFPKPTPGISQDEAVKAFLDNDLLELIYGYKFAYGNEDDTETIQYYPAYTLDAGNIDAMTGEIVYDSDMIYAISYEDFMVNAKEEAESAKEESGFTANEITENVADIDLLTEQEAIEKAKAQIPFIKSASYKKESAILDYNYNRFDSMDGINFVWKIVFSDVYASVDAETGELYNYYYYNDHAKGNLNLSEEECQTIANNYFKSKMPEKYAQSVVLSYNMKENPDFYEFYYIRTENGICCEGNLVNIMVSSHNGQIYSYHCSWDNNSILPQISDALTESQIMNIIAEKSDYSLEYKRIGSDNEIRLVYGFIGDTVGSYYDPYTGRAMNYDGDPYETEILPSYTDIKGLYCENAVTKLLENGFYIDSSGNNELFKPKEKINQLTFFRYLYSQSNDYYEDDEAFYSMLIEEESILSKEESAPNAILTRQEAAKFMIRYLHLDMAGKYPDIYNVKFKDSIDEKYKGYAALVNALGIMTGDSKGRFNGTTQMTNGDAAVVIYRLLNVKYGS